MSACLFGREHTLASVHSSKGVGTADSKRNLTCTGAVTGGAKLKKLMGDHPQAQKERVNVLTYLFTTCKEIHLVNIQNCLCM